MKIKYNIIEEIMKLDDTEKLLEIIVKCNERIAEINAYWGRLIREYRKNKNIKIREMSDRLEISYGFLSDIENGKRGMSEATFSKVYKMLKGE